MRLHRAVPISSRGEYGEAGQTRIDYKTYDLKKASEFPFNTNRIDAIKEIKIVRVPAD
jgi:hypothetical protein